MEGKIVLVTPNCIVAQLADGTFIRHDRSEHLFREGDAISTLDGTDHHHTLYMPATNGHVYLTPDYVSKNGETSIDENGWITEKESSL